MIHSVTVWATHKTWRLCRLPIKGEISPVRLKSERFLHLPHKQHPLGHGERKTFPLPSTIKKENEDIIKFSQKTHVLVGSFAPLLTICNG